MIYGNSQVHQEELNKYESKVQEHVERIKEKVNFFRFLISQKC